MTDTPAVPIESIESPDPTESPAASTAAEQDHANVDQFRGEDADAPTDTGKPAPRDDDQVAEPM